MWVPLSTARRTGLVDQVIEQLRRAITSGEWNVGERIPNEAVLVESLGVGRNTVREAVRALAHAGLLDLDHFGPEVAQHRGAERPCDENADVENPYPRKG